MCRFKFMPKMQSKIEKLIAELCPNGVEFKELGKVCEVLRGKRLTKKELSGNDKYPVFHGGIKPLGYYKKYNRKANATMVINTGSVGEVGYSFVDFWSSDGTFTIKTSQYVDDRFIYFVLKSQESYLKTQKREGGVPTISREAIENIKIPVPPIAIQEEIVKILDSFTELDAELDAELEARKKQYEHYRDDLLSIKNVEYKALGEIGELVRGNGLQKKDFTETGVGCIHYGQIYTYYGTFADKTKTFVSPELAKKLKKAQKGDVLIAGVSENIEDVCKPLCWLGDEICISGDMFAFRHKQNAKFVTYLLQTTNFHKYKERYAQGAKVTRVKTTKILDYKIPVPSLEEQERIVSILDKFDALVNDISIGLPAELSARRQQYEYYRGKLLTFKEKEYANK